MNIFLAYFPDVPKIKVTRKHTHENVIPTRQWWVFMLSLCSVAWAFYPAWASCPYLPYLIWFVTIVQLLVKYCLNQCQVTVTNVWLMLVG